MTVPIDDEMNMNTNPVTNYQQQHGHPMNMNMNMNRQMQRQTVTVAGYTLQQKLGAGSFATVYKAVKYTTTNHNDHTGTDQSESTDGSTTSTAAMANMTTSAQHSNLETVAIKAIDFKSNKITKKVLENLDLEISILTTYQHPNIVSLKQAHKTDQYIYLILEYCAGGDLQGLIRSRKTGRLTEPLARRLMRDLTSGLTFLASHNLIHRDIKPQNLLLTGPVPLDEVNDPCRTQEEEEIRKRVDFPSGEFHLKIADFGFARHLKKTSLADTLCGSPLYMAPEILQHRRYV
jgi:serine/threonine-protein kinase ULK/ATG1